ncbi:UNVERIFIED_CONTAM: U-box domain-containing protein 52 [Sesamum radiatum]|uniref:RING-type E3 ubiquitin transferase n=1 Tax=Sesamum radiatum TaxID=300843 RepID=A0AAW2KE16_SESRA
MCSCFFFKIVDCENRIDVSMEEKNINKVEGLNKLPPPAYSVAAVAVSGSRKSKYVVKWALEKFVPEGLVYFRLLHVRPVIDRIPTPMGNLIPITQVRDDVATAFRKEVEWQATEKLLPYKRMCDQRKVEVEIVQIESDDVVTAVAGEIRKHKISKLVIGASPRSIFSRARTLSAKISECCPTFCTVYAVLKENCHHCGVRLFDCCYWTEQGSIGLFSHFRSASLPEQRFQALSTINQTLLHKRMPSSGIMHPRNLSLDTAGRSNETNISPSGSYAIDTISQASSFTSSEAENPSWGQASTSDISTENQANIDFELEKLRIELRHIRGMYAMAQGEAIDASRKLNEIQKRRLEEDINLKQISVKEEAKELARQEKERHEAARREAEFVKECAERETAERKDAEIRASRETKEKEKLESALNGSFYRYRQFTWDEIISATSSFSDNLKIGMGAYGAVYQCSFQHTTAAVKILHAKEASINKQFQQELEVLSKIRHPNLLSLLGACPERGCLVYEYMENGSLEERLFRKNNSPPIPWFVRYRIAREVASALIFLHNSKPKPIIHRDLKPANILLDQNFVSKVGDVGLSTMLHSDTSNTATLYKDTSPVGTLCYIDPEYQRTGLVSPKSDVYAFGMVVLQLLTAKPAIALTRTVEMAIDDDCLDRVLDAEAGNWPAEETKELAVLALRCTELRHRDRPDLRNQILPALEKLKMVADEARDLAASPPTGPPSHFICPILKVVMNDPCVAADGYSYDRKAIEEWLEENGTSPITSMPLPNKTLIPNYTLLSAITHWKSGQP